eukprot:79018-Alexandrium_andersonii.AAC.1
MTSISLMRPSGRPGPQPTRAGACLQPWGQRPPRSPTLIDEDDELDGRGRQPAQLAPKPAADAVGIALPAD